MPKLLRSSETAGCGATIELDNGEVMYVSIAQSGVLVRKWNMNGGLIKSLFSNFFGPKLYNESNVYKNAQTALALSTMYPEQASPLSFKNPVLAAFSNAIWHCSSTAEVCAVLNEAAARSPSREEGVGTTSRQQKKGTAPSPVENVPEGFSGLSEEQFKNAWTKGLTLAALSLAQQESAKRTDIAKSDEKIVSHFADFIANRNPKPDVFYDVSVLPDPKEDILLAIEREIVRDPSDVRVEWLAVAASFLPSFQEGVGAKPLPWLGVDLADLKRSTPDLKEQAKILAQNPDRDRVEGFFSRMTTESDQIQARVYAALRLREARTRPVRTTTLPQETARPSLPLRHPIPPAGAGRKSVTAPGEQLVFDQANRALIRPNDLLPVIAKYTKAAQRVLSINKEEAIRRTEHGDGGRFALDSLVAVLRDTQAYPGAAHYAKFHLDEDGEIGSMHHGWCFDAFATIDGNERNLLQSLRFADTIDGILSAFFASAILPTVGAYWHGLYHRDYQIVETPNKLNEIMFNGTLNEAVGDTQAILRTPLGLRIQKVGGVKRCICLCHSETEGLLDIEVTVSADGQASEVARTELREPVGRTLY